MMTLESGKQKESTKNLGLIQLCQPPRHPKQNRRRNSRTPSPNSPQNLPPNSSLSPSNKTSEDCSIANIQNINQDDNVIIKSQSSRIVSDSGPVLSFNEDSLNSSVNYSTQSQNISTSNSIHLSFPLLNVKDSFKIDNTETNEKRQSLLQNQNDKILESNAIKPVKQKFEDNFADESNFLAFSEFEFKVKDSKNDVDKPKTSPLSDNQPIPLLPPPPEPRGKSPNRSSTDKRRFSNVSEECKAPSSNNINLVSNDSLTCSSNTVLVPQKSQLGIVDSLHTKSSNANFFSEGPSFSKKSLQNSSFNFNDKFYKLDKKNNSSIRDDFQDPFSPVTDNDLPRTQIHKRKTSFDVMSHYPEKTTSSSTFFPSYLKSSSKTGFSSLSPLSNKSNEAQILSTPTKSCNNKKTLANLKISDVVANESVASSKPKNNDKNVTDSDQGKNIRLDSDSDAALPLLSPLPKNESSSDLTFPPSKISPTSPIQSSPTFKSSDSRKPSASSYKTAGSPTSSTSSFEAFDSPASSIIPYKPFDFPSCTTSMPTVGSPASQTSTTKIFDSVVMTSSSTTKDVDLSSDKITLSFAKMSSSFSQNREIRRKSSFTTTTTPKSSSSGRRRLNSTNFFDFSSMSSETSDYEVNEKSSYNSDFSSDSTIKQSTTSALTTGNSIQVSKLIYSSNIQNCSTAKSLSAGIIPITNSIVLPADHGNRSASVVYSSHISPSTSIKNRQARMTLSGLSVPHTIPSDECSNSKQTTTYTPLTTPDFKIDLLESDGRRPSMVGRFTPPLLPQGFPFITTDDLTPEELHAFDMKWGSPHHARGRRGLMRPTLLALPANRPRMTSLPNRKEDREEEEDEYYRLRHFSITGRAVINRGDSFKSRRSKSNNSVASDVSRRLSIFDGRRSLTPPWIATPLITLSCDDVTRFNEGWAWSHPCSLATSAASSAASSRASSASESAFPFRVVMLGAAGVGKTTLCHQFMTSEHINAYDSSLDDEYGEKSVSIMLDEEESEIELIDHPADEMSVENYLATYNPHAIVVVFSVTDRQSFVRAEEIVQYLWRLNIMSHKGVILVGNKTDLVRNRCVTFKESSNLADSYDCKFIETSSGLNHQVDELLVGIVKQIRLKTNNPEVSREVFRKRSTRRKKFRGTKTSASLKVKSLLTKVCGKEIKSKSCENLHVL